MSIYNFIGRFFSPFDISAALVELIILPPIVQSMVGMMQIFTCMHNSLFLGGHAYGIKLELKSNARVQFTYDQLYASAKNDLKIGLKIAKSCLPFMFLKVGHLGEILKVTAESINIQIVSF